MIEKIEIKKRNLINLYNLPEEVKFCRKCTISNQRPRIRFDEHGVCSACNFAVYKRNQIDWDLREKELTALCDRHRRDDGAYDVVVPVSGGKDGGIVAHELKYKYNMNPLTVTWSPHLYTDIGEENLQNFIDVGGFDNILGRPNGKVHRLLTKLSFIYLGDPFQPFIYGQTNFPLRIAVNHQIPLIMYGENGEVEYGGDMKNAHRPTREVTDHDGHYFSGLPPESWKKYGLTSRDLHAYLAPPIAQVRANNTEIHFYGYYKFWDPQENFYYCREHTGFAPNPERTEGTYSKYASLDDKLDAFHYFLALIKFGIGRATADAAHEIRDSKITREEGMALVRRYDNVTPTRYLDEFLSYCDLSEEQYWEIIDSWRSEHIWKFEDGEWRLRHHVWDLHQQHEGSDDKTTLQAVTGR